MLAVRLYTAEDLANIVRAWVSVEKLKATHQFREAQTLRRR